MALTYNEQAILEELFEYLNSKSYNRAFDYILNSDHGTGFCIGNILNESLNYNSNNRNALLEVLYYSVLALYSHDKTVLANSDVPNETNEEPPLVLESGVA